MKFVSIILFILALFASAFAQPPRKITGIVTDEKGKPLIGASILILWTEITFQTDSLGKFSIDMPESKTQLRICYVGYNCAIVNLNNQNSFIISLKQAEIKENDMPSYPDLHFRKKFLRDTTLPIPKLKQVEAKEKDTVFNVCCGNRQWQAERNKNSLIKVKPKENKPYKDTILPIPKSIPIIFKP